MPKGSIDVDINVDSEHERAPTVSSTVLLSARTLASVKPGTYEPVRVQTLRAFKYPLGRGGELHAVQKRCSAGGFGGSYRRDCSGGGGSCLLCAFWEFFAVKLNAEYDVKDVGFVRFLHYRCLFYNQILLHRFLVRHFLYELSERRTIINFEHHFHIAEHGRLDH